MILENWIKIIKGTNKNKEYMTGKDNDRHLGRVTRYWADKKMMRT